MAPKRKVDDMVDAAPKGKKTTVSKKTTVTTVTIEEPEKKRKIDSVALVPKKSKAKKSPEAVQRLGAPYPPSGGFSSYDSRGFSAGYGFGSSAGSLASAFGNSHQRPSTPSIMPSASYPFSLPATSGQMPLELPPIQTGALSGIPSSSCGGGGKYVWLIYHKSGRHDAQLMGVYTGARTALKNAKSVIDKETGGAERRTIEGADLSDLSPNMQADHGIVYEVKHRNGGKNVVSFKKVKLNEDLSGDDDALESRLPGLMGIDRGAIGWM